MLAKMARLLGFSSPAIMGRDVAISVALTVMALFCSTVYVLGPLLSDLLATSLGFGSSAENVINGVALIGLQFTLPAGLVLDKFGPKACVVVGLLLVPASWIALSFLGNGVSWGVVLLLLIVNSVGEGFAFLSAFKVRAMASVICPSDLCACRCRCK